MPSYRVHRLRDHLRQAFRNAPHVSGTASLKVRDYTPAGEISAASPYAAYFQMRDSESPLEVGDALEIEGGALCVYKYVGFEDAQWVLPEPKPEHEHEAKAEETAETTGT